MKIQETYQRAIKFAGEKHQNQKITGTNSNYLLHLSNVAMEVLATYAVDKNFDIDFAIQLALLHDTIEDTDTNFEEVKSVFGKQVADGVLALTKNETLANKRVQMLDSLIRVNQLGKEVGMVKLADRITNLQEPPKKWSSEKVATYLEEAKIIYEKLKQKNDFLEQRLQKKIEEYSKYLKH